MSSIVQTQTTSFKSQLYQAVHNMLTDTLKIALYTANADLNADTTVYSATNEVTEIYADEADSIKTSLVSSNSIKEPNIIKRMILEILKY